MPSIPEIDRVVDLDACRFVYDPRGHRCPVIRRTRRTLTVDRFGTRHDLRRRDLARDGVAYSGDVRFSITYQAAADSAA